MNKTRSTFLALLAVLLSPLAANADPIVETADCVDVGYQCAIGIKKLNVLGTILDVVFFAGSSFDDVYGVDDPYFLNDSAGAFAARDAIIAAFEDAIYGAVGMGSASGEFASSRILIPHLNNGSSNAGAYAGGYSGTTTWYATAYSTSNSINFGVFEPTYYTSYAVFAATPVPEPGTLALLGIGLLGMGAARRRKKA